MRHSTVGFCPGKESLSARRAPTLRHPGRAGPGSLDFEDRCLSAASKECIIGKSASLPPEPSPKSGVGKKQAEIPHKSNTAKEAYVEPQEPKKYEPRQRPKVTEVEPKKYEPRQRPKITEVPHQAGTIDDPNVLSILGRIGGAFRLFGSHGPHYDNHRPYRLGQPGFPPMKGGAASSPALPGPPSSSRVIPGHCSDPC